MFSGTNTLTFKTNDGRKSVIDFLENEFKALGKMSFTSTDTFTIDGQSFSSSIHETKIQGTFKEKDDRYQLILDYSSSFTVLGTVVFGICIFIWLLGLLWLLLPFDAERRIDKKTERIFGNIRFNYLQ